MRYVLQVVLSNAQHPEYGQATIPFPIPNQNYASPFTDRNDCCMSHHSNPARDLVIREAIPIFVVLSQKNRGCK